MIETTGNAAEVLNRLAASCPSDNQSTAPYGIPISNGISLPEKKSSIFVDSILRQESNKFRLIANRIYSTRPTPKKWYSGKTSRKQRRAGQVRIKSPSAPRWQIRNDLWNSIALLLNLLICISNFQLENSGIWQTSEFLVQHFYLVLFCSFVFFFLGRRLPCVPFQIFPRLVRLSPFPIFTPPFNHYNLSINRNYPKTWCFLQWR